MAAELQLGGKTILVTGGHGFLGSRVVAQLHEQGADNVITPRSSEFDLRVARDVDAMYDQTQPEIVVHLAARVGGIGANRTHPGSLYLDNLLMGTHVIDAARRNETPKIVVIGTICSYPKYCEVPFSEDSLWTGYPEETNAPYGIAKLAQLVQLQANREQYGQQGIYLLPTNLYGPGDNFDLESSHVIPALIRKTLEARDSGQSSIEVWGTGSASREFLYVDDAADAIVRATRLYDGAEPVNLGANEETPIKALAELIAELAEFKGEFDWNTSKPDGQPRRRVDNSRAAELFGFKASTSLRDGLRRTIDWYGETAGHNR